MKRSNTAKWIKATQRWQINVQKDGQRKTFTSATPGRTGQREANKKADEWLENGVSTERVKTQKAWELFIENKALTSKDDSAKAEYFGRCYLIPAIGNKAIKSVTEQDYQSILNQAFKNPVSSKKRLSKKTLQTFRSFITQFAKFCRRSGYSSLVIDELTVPASARKVGKKVLPIDGVKTLFNTDTIVYFGKQCRDEYINYYRFQVLTGVRPGELRGLRWADVKGNVCQIKGSINVHGDKTQGKNENSKRAFILSPLAMNVLKDQKQYTGKLPYVFPMTSMHTYYGRWKKYQECNNLPGISLYELRHTFVSIAKALPEGELRQIVGHSENMDTYDTYSHYLSGDGEMIASTLQDIFSKII